MMKNQQKRSIPTTSSFPWILHDMLNNANAGGYKCVVRWQPHGRAFIVHDVAVFVSTIMPMYFHQSKYKSFQRQLSLYGFRRLTSGLDQGAYFHPEFIRSQRSKCSQVTRKRAAEVRRKYDGKEEPNFYSIPWATEDEEGTTTNLHLYMRLRSPLELQRKVLQQQTHLSSHRFAQTVHSIGIKNYVSHQVLRKTTGSSSLDDSNPSCGDIKRHHGTDKSITCSSRDIHAIDPVNLQLMNELNNSLVTKNKKFASEENCNKQELNVASEHETAYQFINNFNENHVTQDAINSMKFESEKHYSNAAVNVASEHEMTCQLKKKNCTKSESENSIASYSVVSSTFLEEETMLNFDQVRKMDHDIPIVCDVQDIFEGKPFFLVNESP